MIKAEEMFIISIITLIASIIMLIIITIKNMIKSKINKNKEEEK